MGLLDVVVSLFTASSRRATQLEVAAAQRATTREVADRTDQRALATETIRAKNAEILAARREKAAIEQERYRQAGQMQLADHRALLASYPYRSGPGKLRQAVRMQGHGDDGQGVPLVLFIPPDDTALKASPWSGLGRLEGDLSSMSGGPFPFVVARLDHRTNWPDPDLYNHDLYDIPTITVRVEVDRKRLDIWVGGCGIAPPAREQQAVLREQYAYGLRYRDAEWASELVDELNATAITGGSFPLAGGAAQDVLELNLEHASRAIRLCAIAAVDAYYLMRDVGYDEKIDAALRSAGLASADFPPDAGLPLEQIVDPAHHLLHRAGRHLLRGGRQEAVAALASAFAVLGGESPEDVRPGRDDWSPDALDRGLRLASDHHLDKARDLASAVQLDIGPRADFVRSLALPRETVRERYPVPGAEPPAIGSGTESTSSLFGSAATAELIGRHLRGWFDEDSDEPGFDGCDVYCTRSLAFSNDGRHLAVGDAEVAAVWDVVTGERVYRRRSGRDNHVTFPDASSVWIGTGRKLVARGIDVPETLLDVRLGADVKTVASNSNHILVLTDVATLWDRRGRVPFPPIVRSPWPMALSGQSDLLASGDYDGVSVLDTSDGRVVQHVGTRSDTGVRSVAFSPDGALLAVASGRAVTIRDPRSRDAASVLRHGDDLNCVRFTPDGRHVVTGCDDGRWSVWDVRDGRRVGRVDEGESVEVIAISPNGEWVAVGTRRRVRMAPFPGE